MKIVNFYLISDALAVAKHHGKSTVKIGRYHCLLVGEMSLEDFECMVELFFPACAGINPSGMIWNKQGMLLKKYYYEVEGCRDRGHKAMTPLSAGGSSTSFNMTSSTPISPS